MQIIYLIKKASVTENVSAMSKDTSNPSYTEISLMQFGLKV